MRMGGREGGQFGDAASATGAGEFATRSKSAAGNRLRDIGGEARDGVKFHALGLERGDRALQGARVGMARRMKESARVGGFDDATGIHNLDAVAETGDNPEIMRDEHNRHAQFPLHFFDQLENLRLHRDIEGGGRFVGDKNLGFGDERHGDHYALSHAAGEFVRVIMDTLGCVVDADGIKHREGAAEGIAPGNLFVNEKRLDELFADPQVGI